MLLDCDYSIENTRSSIIIGIFKNSSKLRRDKDFCIFDICDVLI